MFYIFLGIFLTFQAAISLHVWLEFETEFAEAWNYGGPEEQNIKRNERFFGLKCIHSHTGPIK